MAITMPSVTPSAGVSRSNETDAASAMAAKAPNRRTLFSQRSGRFLNASSLTTPAKVAPLTLPASSAAMEMAMNPNEAASRLR